MKSALIIRFSHDGLLKGIAECSKTVPTMADKPLDKNAMAQQVAYVNDMEIFFSKVNAEPIV